ncbi:fam-b protein [Plasmodium vinckei brucechwatti]|uniref:Fam-b protein n=1 Tax=Plasmodium vinckei brucechwatti TaxID=119398 RepID=A0A6V7RWA1_PLAVN|nr:fam-b protein [Plasmodium vinckei brucechwatti]
MRASILKFVLFSIVICSFEYSQNGSDFVNERNIYLEKNITKFVNNRALADADNKFDLNDFYSSTLDLANQFSDYIGDDDEVKNLRNVIDSHVKKHKESNTAPNLNNVNEETKKTIYKLQREIEEAKNELDNKRDHGLTIQSTHDKKTTKNDKKISESKHEDFKKFKIKGNFLKGIHNALSSSDNNELSNNSEIRKIKKKMLVKVMSLIGFSLALLITGGTLVPMMFLISLTSYDIIKKMIKVFRMESNNPQTQEY